MATHSSVLAWRIPGTGEPGGLPSMGSHRVGHNWSDLAAAASSKRANSPWKSVEFPIQTVEGNHVPWSEVKWKWLSRVPTLWDPVDYTVRGILQARILEWVAVPFSRGSSQPRDWTQVSRIAGRFFTSWATPWFPKPNTGGGSLSLCQLVELPNPGGFSQPRECRGLLHCRQILYQLSYQGSSLVP